MNITVGQIRDIMVVSQFRDVVPGGQMIVPVVLLVLNKNLEGSLLPPEENTDKCAAALHIERVLTRAAEKVGVTIYVPGVKTGAIATFVKWADEKKLWQTFREVASKS